MIQFLAGTESSSCSSTRLVKSSDLAGIQIVNSLDDINGVHLWVYNEMLSLADKENTKVLPVAVDFLKPILKKRLLSSRIKSELLNKTLGKKHGYKTVLDATAGMGVDSMIFASLGLDVIAFEKSAAIYLLLKDGLNRAFKDESLASISEKVNLQFADSLSFTGEVDVIYIDFMFSKADKKAKSKKNMEIFKKITSIPSDAGVTESFTQYLGFKFKRLVFKRPLKVEVLRIGNFSHSVVGKAIRYDIYLP